MKNRLHMLFYFKQPLAGPCNAHDGKYIITGKSLQIFFYMPDVNINDSNFDIISANTRGEESGGPHMKIYEILPILWVIAGKV